MKADWWPAAISHLSKSDPVVKSLIQRYPESQISRTSTAFRSIVNSIVGQQISVKAASAIRQRLEQIGIEASVIAQMDVDALKQVGLSTQKSRYIIGIAQWFVKHDVTEAWFEQTPNAEIGEALLSLKGVGPWTWQMFQMFYLLEPDIMSTSDIGLQNAVVLLYGCEKSEAVAFLNAQSQDRWSPYTSAVCWFLWRSLDPVEINY